MHRPAFPFWWNMIDPMNEQLIALLDVRKTIPISVPTLRRWAASGKLETVHAGGRVFTSAEAVSRMLKHGPSPSQAPALPPTRKQQKHDREVAGTMDRLRQRLGGF